MSNNFFFPQNLAVCEIKWKNCRASQGTFALLAGCLSVQTHTEQMLHLLLFHGKNGNANAPPYCVIRTLRVVVIAVFWLMIEM